MPSTLVIYVRHGRTPTTGTRLPGRTPGLHLSDKGRQQAKAVAEKGGSPVLLDVNINSVEKRTHELNVQYVCMMTSINYRIRIMYDLSKTTISLTAVLI